MIRATEAHCRLDLPAATMCPLRLFVVLMLASTCYGALPSDPEAGNQLDDIDLDTEGFLHKYGYPVEKYYVTTDDGYILCVFRVPYSPKSPLNDTVKPPVLLVHGILSSSVDYVVNGPGKSLAYLLADAGYDVWLANLRGNSYSRNHTKLDPEEPEFWKFSFHEVGVHDIPCVIDFILDNTGQSQLFYVGHSMGTTVFYITTSEKPQYNDKIRVMVGLAPIAYMNHMFSPFFQFLSKFEGPVGVLIDLLGGFEFAPKNELFSMVCGIDPPIQELCTNVMYLISGYNPGGINETMVPVYLAHVPAGSSVMQQLHFVQEINSGHFRQYDHEALNLFIYGSLFPPDYDLSRITAPIVLFYAANDWLSAVEDVERLYEQLPNPVGKFLVENSFGHMDFLWGIDVKHLVYDSLISLLAQY